ncbi:MULTISPECIES: hypothetical protein [Clostridium]|uniref:hypothetical protein n=1 Tax=Clostridium TaxID=1485 RepID=UPI00059DD7EA|nr:MULTISPECIES: hypothetical protein [Clostridium]KIN79774.1 hypothetical protein SD74_18975 [Clostridium botulinum]MBA4510314.1 hypothetical protein [Clostridium sporogenes]MCC5428831.1 hypothetical protein [Clostridium botulinum]
MDKKRCCYEVAFLDVSRKWLDNTKTTVELIYYDELGTPTVLAYVHTDDAVETAKSKRNEYIDLMLKTIKENIIS